MANFQDYLLLNTTGDVHIWKLPNIKGQGRERHIGTRDEGKIAAFLKKHDEAGFGCFFCAATIKPGSPRKKEFALEMPGLHTDTDFKNLDLDPAEIEQRLRDLPLVPSRMHHTGNGIHNFWNFRTPILLTEDTLPRIETVLRKMANFLGSDPLVAHVVALLRVPGTHNSKRGEWKEVRIIREGRERYTLEKLEQWMATAGDPVMVRRGTHARPLNAFERAAEAQGFRAPIDVEQRLRGMVVGGDGDSGVHATQLSVTASLMARNVDEDEIVKTVLEATQELPGTEGWDWLREERTIREMCTDWTKKHPREESVARISLADAVATRSNKGDDLPVVQVHAGELPEVAKRAEEILIASEVAMYQRGGTLVRPVIETTDASHGRKTKVARLVTIVPVYLRNKLGQVARWQKYDKRGKKYLPIDVPTEIAPIILASEGEWTFPAIAGVITTPTMRPDGTILDKPGYDEATRLLLVEPPPMPPIPDAPTKEQALASLRLLGGLLNEFPFVDDVAESVALSGIITPVVRGAFSVGPMHISRAPAPGSGKSYLWDITAAIAIGQLMPVMAAGRNEEETEKRLGAALLTGQPLISIDNVNGELGGDFLCQAIERPLIEVRILGKSERVRIEARGTTMFGTGNNVIIVGDLCRRVMTSALDPRIERPEEREFTGDPVATVLANRGMYIAAALTVCRAYVAAGQPQRAKRLASFEGWSDIVRSALMWLGKADPTASMVIARADDPERAELRDVLNAWADTIGVGHRYRITLPDLIAIAEERSPAGVYDWPELNAALNAVCRGRRDQNTARSFGIWARGRKDRIVDGLSLARSRTEGHNAQTYWWIEGEERAGAWNAEARNTQAYPPTEHWSHRTR